MIVLTDLYKTQVLALAPSFQGKPLDMDMKMNNDNGVNYLMEELDKLKRTKEIGVMQHLQNLMLHRNSNMNMSM